MTDTQYAKGFTLIELMLVVIIIGILAAMVMPRLVGRTEEARIAAAEGDIKATIPMALDLYEMDYGSYPQDLKKLMEPPTRADGKIRGAYLKRQPKDPWGNDYIYTPPGENGQDYKLSSEGPKKDDASDDICSWK